MSVQLEDNESIRIIARLLQVTGPTALLPRKEWNFTQHLERFFEVLVVVSYNKFLMVILVILKWDSSTGSKARAV